MANKDEIKDKWEEIMTLVDESMMHSSFVKWIRPLQPLFYEEDNSTLFIKSKRFLAENIRNKHLLGQNTMHKHGFVGSFSPI